MRAQIGRAKGKRTQTVQRRIIDPKSVLKEISSKPVLGSTSGSPTMRQSAAVSALAQSSLAEPSLPLRNHNTLFFLTAVARNPRMRATSRAQSLG